MSGQLMHDILASFAAAQRAVAPKAPEPVREKCWMCRGEGFTDMTAEGGVRTCGVCGGSGAITKEE